MEGGANTGCTGTFDAKDKWEADNAKVLGKERQEQADAKEAKDKKVEAKERWEGSEARERREE